MSVLSRYRALSRYMEVKEPELLRRWCSWAWLHENILVRWIIMWLTK